MLYYNNVGHAYLRLQQKIMTKPQNPELSIVSGTTSWKLTEALAHFVQTVKLIYLYT